VAGFHLEQAVGYRDELGAAVEPALRSRAGTLLAQAGSDAFGRGDLPAATSLLSRAAALLPEDDPSLAAVLGDLGSAEMKTNEFKLADETLTRALEAAQRLRDRRVELRVGLDRQFLRSFTAPDDAGPENIRVAEAAMAELEHLGDDLGLAKAWWLKGEGHGYACHWQARADALERGLAHARRAEAREEASVIAGQLALALYFGPTPAALGSERCRELLAESGGDRALRAAVSTSLAGLEAMTGAVDGARALYAEAVAIHEELGMHFRRLAFSSVGAAIELLAGDAAAAERELADACAALAAAGERGVRSALEAVLAQLLVVQGRDDEAERLARSSAEAAGASDIGPQVLWRAALARVLVRRGELVRARELADEAVARADSTDFPDVRASALAASAEVAAADDPVAAGTLLDAARDVYLAKGNLVAAAALGGGATLPSDRVSL
jgi:tetratricopeptide (TPR) repeat protein